MLVAARQMKVSVHRLLVDPEFYLFNYEPSAGMSEFLIVNEELLERAPFIDVRLAPHARGQFSVPTSELTRLVGNEPGARPRQHFIFHHAFVCSTLMARCLARSDAFFSLKEPQILRELSDLKHEATLRGVPEPAWARLLDTHLRLLAKRYSHGSQVIVKASNVANNLIGDILAGTGDGRLLYLHATLPEFLVANLKKPPATRERIPALLRRVLRYSDLPERLPDLAVVDELDFLQRCGLLWLASQFAFLQQAEGDGRKRTATLTMREFLSEPRTALSRVSRFFGHDPTECELDRMTDPSLLERHAKDPRRRFDRTIRREENASIFRAHSGEIGRVAEWIAPAVGSLEIESRLARLGLAD